jgi:RecA-family ATPase
MNSEERELTVEEIEQQIEAKRQWARENRTVKPTNEPQNEPRTVVVPKPQIETKKNVILPFKIKNGFELASTAPPNIPSLVDGLLIEVGTSLLSADPKCGKSTLVRQLMVDIAEGRDFWGFPTLSGDSAYLYLEGPIGVVQQHFQKLGLTNRRGKIHVIDERMPNDAVFGLERLSETVKGMPNLRLVVVDPLPKLLHLKDSTSTDQVVPAMEVLEKFAKDHNLHVMALVHEKKRKNKEDRYHVFVNLIWPLLIFSFGPTFW